MGCGEIRKGHFNNLELTLRDEPEDQRSPDIWPGITTTMKNKKHSVKVSSKYLQ